MPALMTGHGGRTKAAPRALPGRHARGAEMTQDDWNDGNLRTLGIWYGKRSNWAGPGPAVEDPAATGDERGVE